MAHTFTALDDLNPVNSSPGGTSDCLQSTGSDVRAPEVMRFPRLWGRKCEQEQTIRRVTCKHVGYRNYIALEHFKPNGRQRLNEVIEKE